MGTRLFLIVLLSGICLPSDASCGVALCHRLDTERESFVVVLEDKQTVWTKAVDRAKATLLSPKVAQAVRRGLFVEGCPEDEALASRSKPPPLLLSDSVSDDDAVDDDADTASVAVRHVVERNVGTNSGDFSSWLSAPSLSMTTEREHVLASSSFFDKATEDAVEVATMRILNIAGVRNIRCIIWYQLRRKEMATKALTKNSSRVPMPKGRGSVPARKESGLRYAWSRMECCPAYSP